ncbi:MAG: hypothetical protein ACK2UY_05555 [Anaerolineae bacterium]|jgi:hypothetical protein
MTQNREKPDPEEVERLRRRLGAPDPRQVEIWRAMSGARRLELVGQAYHLALETTRASERGLDPGVSPEELDRRVIRRMHGDVLPRGIDE